jgi:hypothetical protein
MEAESLEEEQCSKLTHLKYWPLKNGALIYNHNIVVRIVLKKKRRKKKKAIAVTQAQ